MLFHYVVYYDYNNETLSYQHKPQAAINFSSQLLNTFAACVGYRPDTPYLRDGLALAAFATWRIDITRCHQNAKIFSHHSCS